MTGKILYVATAALCVVIGFAAGRWHGADRVAALPRYRLGRPLTLQAVAGQVGSLPKGATLYEYRVLPETTTYVVFVNTKSRDLLTPSRETGPVIHPIDAYVEGVSEVGSQSIR